MDVLLGWSVSTLLHAAAAAGFALAWFGTPEEKVRPVFLKPSRAARPEFLRVPAPASLLPEPADRGFTTEHPSDPWGVRGESIDFVSDKPLKGRGVYDPLGTQGGAGGRFGHQLWKRHVPEARTGAEPGDGGLHDNLEAAIGWLARHQNPDGFWSVTGFAAGCDGTCLPSPGDADFDIGVTGLALLALQEGGAAYLPQVRKGLRFLMSVQHSDGCIGPRSASKYMYNHIVATLALVEAWTRTRSVLLETQTRMALDFLLTSQNPGKGWRYSERCGDNDSSVTGWALLTLDAAQRAGLAVPKTAFADARAWLGSVTETAAYSRVHYTVIGGCHPVWWDIYDRHETLTALAFLVRPSPAGPVTELLLRDPPRWDETGVDFAYWHFGARALAAQEARDWTAWRDRLRGELTKHQRPAEAGCKAGSWEPADRWSWEAGRVYATALNALTLRILVGAP